MQLRFLLLLFFSFGIIQNLSAQQKKGALLNNLDTLRVAKMQFGKTKLTPFLAPTYSPETQLMGSAGGLLTFSFQKNNPLLDRSSIPFSVGYSTNGSFLVNIRSNLYGHNDKVRAIGDLWLKDMPDHYWGVGYQNGRYREKSDSTTGYQRKYWRFYEKVVYHFFPNCFAGGIIDFNKTSASDLNSIMRQDLYIEQYGTEIRNSGFGVVLSYDSRDMGLNAYNGLFLDLSAIFYGKIMGGKNRYQAIQLDYRHYKQLGKKRRVLAWQVKSHATFGDVPWTEMAQLGTPFDLRGYTWGRYRDKAYAFGLVEYRQMFQRKKPNKKGSYDFPMGFVTWIGLGTLGDLSNGYINRLPNVGVGLRFEIQPRMNVRIDYGIGKGRSSAFYVSFGEAF